MQLGNIVLYNVGLAMMVLVGVGGFTYLLHRRERSKAEMAQSDFKRAYHAFAGFVLGNGLTQYEKHCLLRIRNYVDSLNNQYANDLVGRTATMAVQGIHELVRSSGGGRSTIYHINHLLHDTWEAAEVALRTPNIRRNVELSREYRVVRTLRPLFSKAVSQAIALESRASINSLKQSIEN